jgi:DNA-directed RNA polymerase specialized sigma subunit
VDNPELQTILELRYLSNMYWEEIAIELGYGIDNVFRLHRNALDEIEIPERIQ